MLTDKERDQLREALDGGEAAPAAQRPGRARLQHEPRAQHRPRLDRRVDGGGAVLHRAAPARPREVPARQDQRRARAARGEGTIDECEDCGEPIGFKRLLARPVTTLCIDCKEEREKEEQAQAQQRRAGAAPATRDDLGGEPTRSLAAPARRA